MIINDRKRCYFHRCVGKCRGERIATLRYELHYPFENTSGALRDTVRHERNGNATLAASTPFKPAVCIRSRKIRGYNGTRNKDKE